MSEFLDELARSLAKPMPRSRALRLLGTSIVAAAVPLAGPRLRPARASGFSTANCSDPGLCSGLPGRTKVCGCDFLASCYKECCNPATEHCCIYPPFPGATGGSSVCEKACCPLGTDCGTASKPCVPKCPVPCGPQKECCKPDEECQTYKVGKFDRGTYKSCIRKCTPGSRRCRTDGVAILGCCPNGQNCCSGLCCDPEQVCVRALGTTGKPFRLCVRKCAPPQARCNFICCDADKRAYRKLPNGRIKCSCVAD